MSALVIAFVLATVFPHSLCRQARLKVQPLENFRARLLDTRDRGSLLIKIDQLYREVCSLHGLNQRERLRDRLSELDIPCRSAGIGDLVATSLLGLSGAFFLLAVLMEIKKKYALLKQCEKKAPASRAAAAPVPTPARSGPLIQVDLSASPPVVETTSMQTATAAASSKSKEKQFRDAVASFFNEGKKGEARVEIHHPPEEKK